MDGHRAPATALTESRLQADSPSLPGQAHSTGVADLLISCSLFVNSSSTFLIVLRPD